jgi:hypothetical protein
MADFDPNAGTAGTGLITSSTPEYTGYPTYTAGEKAQVIPIVKTTKATEADLAASYGQMAPALRLAIAQQLKDAGYNVPLTGEYSAAVRDQFIQANRDLSTELNVLATTDPKRLEQIKYDLTTFLKDKSKDIQKSGTGGPSATKSTQILTDARALALVTQLYRSALNAEPTAEEAAKLVKKVQDAQRKNPVITKYKTVNGVSEQITTGGLDEEDFLLTEIKKDPRYKAKVQEKQGGIRQDLANTARANGLDLDKNFGSAVGTWISRIENGEDPDVIKQAIRNTAKLGLPDKVGQLIDQGIDLESIYSPYRNTMASVLEVAPDSISLSDPTLRNAIGPDKEMSIYDFQKALRKDSRWQYTNNAREEVAGITQRILQDFGFQG